MNTAYYMALGMFMMAAINLHKENWTMHIIWWTGALMVCILGGTIK